MKTICGSDALARAALVSDRQWVSLMADPVFCNQVEFVLGAGVWPACGKLCDGGSGMNYITGLILLLREQKEAANVPFPRGVLHELCRPQLPKLVDMFNGDVTVKAPLSEDVRKPFAYIVRSAVCTDECMFIHRQRVFQSEHDQAQCFRQWHEHFASQGIKIGKENAHQAQWWEITKHTVFEGAA